MSCSLARTGRHRQRYEDQFRLVAGFEKVAQNNLYGFEKRLLVLMISSANRDDLVFPKGGWEDDETMTEAACREALEEAGVRGILHEEPLGDWTFRSKSRQNSCSSGGGCRGYMFALEVTEELNSWPEQTIYDRKWLTVDEAFKSCRYDWMREALRRLLEVLFRGRTEETREELEEFSASSVLEARVAADQKLPSICFGKPSGTQHLDESFSKCAVLG